MEGYNVLLSKNGENGIYLTKFQLPNLIISDIKLPGLSGFDLLSHFKSDTQTSSIPFLFLIAYSEKGIIEKGLELGATDYLIKPCTIQLMLSTVKRIITAFSPNYPNYALMNLAKP